MSPVVHVGGWAPPAPEFELPASFIHEWRFDEGSGETIQDHIGSNDATRVSGSEPSWQSGYMSFVNADGDHLSLASGISAIHASGAYSIAALIRLDTRAPSSERTVFVSRNGGGIMALQLDEAGRLGIKHRDGGEPEDGFWSDDYDGSGTALSTSTWWFVVGIHDGSGNFTWYVEDGGSMVEATNTGAISDHVNSGGGSGIGAQQVDPGSREWDGDIAWIGIASAELSVSEVDDTWDYVQSAKSGVLA